MSATRVRDSSTPRQWLDVLRSWLQTRSAEYWQSIKAVPDEARGPTSPCYGKVGVLVADDDPVNLLVISALLKSRGLLPLLAADGAEAAALACELEFDLILMDLQMPILDGLGATSEIRRFERDSSRPAVPVVAYTGISPGERMLAAHGLNGTLNKPCSDEELEECLIRWCPTYCPAQPVRSGPHDNDFWAHAVRSRGASGAR